MSIKRECFISQCDECEWDELLPRFADRTVYHTSACLRALGVAHHLTPHLVRADMHGRCVALWPCFELRKGPFTILGSPLPGWSTAYLGPLFALDDGATDVQLILQSM